MSNQNRKATREEMARVRRVIKEAFPDLGFQQKATNEGKKTGVLTRSVEDVHALAKNPQGGALPGTRDASE
jgi:hypothetical protein